MKTERGKAVENGLRQSVPVIQYEGKKPDVENLLCESLDYLVFTGSPSQRGQHDVDPNQDLDQKTDVTGDQSETAVDVAAEDVKEALDNGDVLSHEASDLISAPAVPCDDRRSAPIPQDQ